jgi:hypothetical protein
MVKIGLKWSKVVKKGKMVKIGHTLVEEHWPNTSQTQLISGRFHIKIGSRSALSESINSHCSG